MITKEDGGEKNSQKDSSIGKKTSFIVGNAALGKFTRNGSIAHLPRSLGASIHGHLDVSHIRAVFWRSHPTGNLHSFRSCHRGLHCMDRLGSHRPLLCGRVAHQ